MAELILDRDRYSELEKLAIGAFHPVAGFMDEDDFYSVVDTMRLRNGEFFPFPIVLDLSPAQARAFRGRPRIPLVYAGREVGEIRPQSFFTCDKGAVAKKIYGTADPAHPGVAQFLSMGDVFVGGPVSLGTRIPFECPDRESSPVETKKVFAERGWKQVVGFATRNVPHRAHEYLQTKALESVDGLFIQVTVGRKKVGDYTARAIVAAYDILIDDVYGSERAFLSLFSTALRYAGPREALLQAVIRRNYGCTHFIIGRDHSGVGDYYGQYEAHDLSRRFEGELGIEIMRMQGPYYCAKCGRVVTEQSCAHQDEAPEFVKGIKGTEIRATYASGREVDPDVMRTEVIEGLKSVKWLIDDRDVRPGSSARPAKCSNS